MHGYPQKLDLAGDLAPTRAAESLPIFTCVQMEIWLNFGTMRCFSQCQRGSLRLTTRQRSQDRRLCPSPDSVIDEVDSHHCKGWFNLRRILLKKGIE